MNKPILTGEEIVSAELWIDEKGLAHSQIHTSNKATFQYTKAALEAFVKQLQWQLDNGDKCPFHNE